MPKFKIEEEYSPLEQKMIKELAIQLKKARQNEGTLLELRVVTGLEAHTMYGMEKGKGVIKSLIRFCANLGYDIQIIKKREKRDISTVPNGKEKLNQLKLTNSNAQRRKRGHELNEQQHGITKVTRRDLVNRERTGSAFD